ncbi:MAG: hypothetical protein MJZ19_07145 [Paludibacteraceae bacterium]|nr:hypothetical protein [Paludibacteraceae bacterium]
MKIGLWLQDHRNDTEERFNEVMDIVKKSDVDLVVLPEYAYIPFNDLLNGDLVFMDSAHAWYKAADEYAKKIGKPVIFSSSQAVFVEGDDNGEDFIFAYYTNPNAKDDETIARVYFKNTKTGFSPLSFEDYKESIFNAWNQFAPIVLKGQKIGMTICYDCNHPIFSALYGVQGIDILINMTGGNVDYHKWYRYNQVRAIENECFSLVTMGYDASNNENSYVYGFDSTGAHMSFSNLMNPSTKALNLLDSVYVFDTENYTVLPPLEPSEPSENKYQDISVEVGEVSKLIEKAEKLTEFLYILKQGNDNIIFVICDDETIMVPEFVCSKLYVDVLKDLKNKKYIIVNRWENLDKKLLDSQLDSLLRVRAMENFCAVILESPIANRCYQTSKNRKSQVVKEVDGKFGIDLSRTTGPEAIWQNKNGIRASWREGYETLIDICYDLASHMNDTEK